MTAPEWRAVLLTYTCTTCGARPGRECRTKSGTIASPPHIARHRAARLCRSCGLPIRADDTDQTGLCPACDTYTALLVERYRPHREEP